MYDVASQVRDKCLCALGEFSIEAVISGIDRFHKDFEVAAGEPQTATGELGTKDDYGKVSNFDD